MQGFFAALVVDAVLVDEAAVVVPHCQLFAVLGFDAVTACVFVVNDSGIAVAFHLVVHLVVVAMLSPLGGTDVHIDVE